MKRLFKLDSITEKPTNDEFINSHLEISFSHISILGKLQDSNEQLIKSMFLSLQSLKSIF